MNAISHWDAKIPSLNTGLVEEKWHFIEKVWHEPGSLIQGVTWIGYLGVNCYTLIDRICQLNANEDNRVDEINSLVASVILSSVDTASSLSYVINWMHEASVIDIGMAFFYLTPFANVLRLFSSVVKSFTYCMQIIDAEEIMLMSISERERRWGADKLYFALINTAANVMMWAFVTLTLVAFFVPTVVFPVILLPGLLVTSGVLSGFSLGYNFLFPQDLMESSFPTPSFQIGM